MTDNAIILPPIEPSWLPDLERQALDHHLELHACKLPPPKLWLYRLAYFFRVGPTRQLWNALYLHRQALKREQVERRLKRELIPEAKLFARLIQHRLAYLGMADVEREKGKRQLKHVVRFRFPVYMSAEAFYYRVLTTTQSLIHQKSALPYKTRATDLVDNETIRDLELTINRQITVRWEAHKGLWVIVWRLKDQSGLPNLVHFHDMLPHFEPGQAELCLGVSEHRRIEIVRLRNVAHVLIGGETGGGKSNTMNSFICGLIRHNSPRDLQLLLIDLKGGVELADYEDIPHLATPTITEQNIALLSLRKALAVAKQRYVIMREARVRNLDQYNSRKPEGSRIPRLIIFVDELAEILLGESRAQNAAIESVLIRLCQLGRAAGVHVIGATQRPSKDVISTNIQANMPLKFSHKMGKPADGFTIMGTGDPASLEPVPGRACFKIGWQIIKVQPPLITAPNIAESIAIAQEYPIYEMRLPSYEETEAILAEEAGPVFDDEQALRVMLIQAEGKLGVHALMSVLNISQWQASVFQQRVAYSVFHHDGTSYRVEPHNKSYRIVPFDERVLEEPPEEAAQETDWQLPRTMLRRLKE